MRGEEIPNEIVSRNTDRAVEGRVVRNLLGIVHGLGIPGVDSADELVESHFGVGKAPGRTFLGDGRGCGIGAEARRGVEYGAAVIAGPIVERRVLAGVAEVQIGRASCRERV